MEKSFEALEKIAVHMATTVWPDYSHEAKTGKLEEEFAELMEVFHCHEFKDQDGGGSVFIQSDKKVEQSALNLERTKDEMSDLLFVLLQISNKIGFTGADLIHHATNKLFQRIKDPNYNRD